MPGPEVLAAELRLGIEKFNSDLNKATKAAERGTKDISESFDKIDDAVKDLPKDFGKLNKEIERTKDQLSKTAQSGSKFTGFLTTLKGGIAALGLAAAGKALFDFGRSMVDASQQLKSVQQQLEIATGSFEAAGQAMAFIREETNRLGQNTLTGAQGFARLANAAKGTAVEGEGVRQIFSALNELSIANRLSTQQYGNVMNQVTQIISKQRIQTEELITLSENGIPAFRLLSEAIGSTGEQLADSLSKGEVPFESILLLTQKIRDEFGGIADEASTSIPASFQRVKNAITGGFADLFGGVLDSQELRNVFSDLAPGIDDFFPTRAEVTQRIDDIVKMTTAIFALIQSLAQGIKQVVIDSFNAVIDAAKSALTAITGFFTDFFERSGLRERFADISSKLKGLFGGGQEAAKKEAEEINKELGKIGEDVGDQRALFERLLLPKPEDIRKLNDKVRELFGLKDLPLLDPETTGSAAKKSANRMTDEYAKALEKIKQQSQTTVSTSVDKATERAIERERRRSREADLEMERKRLEIEDRIAAEIRLAEKMYREVLRTGEPILPLTEEEQKRLDEIQKTFDNVKDHIQSTLGDVITNVFQGQLGGVQGFADSMVQIFARTAGEISAALVIDPLLDKSLNTLVGDFRETGKLGGLLGKALGGVNLKLGGQGITGKQIFGAVGGIAGGIGLGAGISGAVGGGPAGGALGGLAGGALAGATIGSIFPGIGTVVGGIIGSVVGGLAGLTAGFLGGEDKPRIAPLTSAGPPGRQEGGAISRGPFGFVTLVPESTEGVNAETVTKIISELDFQIARLMTDRQRGIVTQALQTQHYALDAREIDDAIAQALQTRLFIAVRELAGPDAARQITGQPYTGTAENIELIQKRVVEALSILKLVEEFRAGPLTQSAAAIKAINDQFRDLIDRATQLELFAVIPDLEAERQRQIRQIAIDFNKDINQRILQLTDPVAAQWAELAARQEQELAEARDAGADLAAVERLHALEREDLARRLADSTGQVNQSLEEVNNILERIARFQRGTLSQVTQQLLSLQDQFDALAAEASAAGIDISGLAASLHAQRVAIIQAAQEQVLITINSIVSPFTAAMIQLEQQVRQFQQLANEGIIPQSFVDQFIVAATDQARFQEAARIAGGQGGAVQQFLGGVVHDFVIAGTSISNLRLELEQLHDQAYNLQQALLSVNQPIDAVVASLTQQHNAILSRAREQVQSVIDEFRNPFTVAMEQARANIETLQQLVRDGLANIFHVAQAERLIMAETVVQEAIRRIEGGGSGSSIEQVAEAFDEFIRAGNPLTQTQQELFNLTETFINLVDAAHLLGISTAELEASYRAQADTIRERLIEEIEQQADVQMRALEQIDDFIERIRVAPEQPLNIRIDEAIKQFLDAINTQDISDIIAKADQYRTLARQQFGSSWTFFAIENQIEEALLAVRERERRLIEQERQRIIDQTNREIRQLQIGESSLDRLQRISVSAYNTERGIDELIMLAREANERDSRTVSLLERVVQEIRA